MHNNASSSEKVHLLLSSHIKIHQHISLKLIWTVFSCKLCLICAYFSPDSDEMTFFNEEINITVLFLTNMQIFTSQDIINGLEWCGLLVDYCDVFISCLDSHSDGTHSLQRIHCWAGDGMLHFSKSVLMKKQTPLHLGWPEAEYIFSKFSFLSELFL